LAGGLCGLLGDTAIRVFAKTIVFLGAVTVRGLGCAVILLGVAKVLGGTSGGTSEVIWTFIITGIVLVAPAILAMVELFFHKNIKQQNL
jgi:hypothetical protein